VGYFFYPLIKGYLFNNITVICLTLLLGGIFIFWLPTNPKVKTKLTFLDYFKIGLFQSLSIIPGTSRSLMTIIGGLSSGMNLTESLKYSFLLAIPTIGAATALDLLKNKDMLLQSPQNSLYFIVGFFLSFLTAKLSINFFLNIVKNKGLKPFGYYRIILAFIIFCLSVLPLWKLF